MVRYKSISAVVVSIAIAFQAAAAQQHRPPAVPLVANDPYFSIWSMADHLTDQPTKHWSETAQPLVGLIRIDDHLYRWMGTMPRGYHGNAESPEVMKQTPPEPPPLHTRKNFLRPAFDWTLLSFRHYSLRTSM